MRRKNPKIKNVPDLPSPCTGICSMDMQNQYCLGCFRTRNEIGGWALMNNEEKLEVVKQLRVRRRESRNTETLP
ncbi:DUF1289 domain-containing protein [uncultured Sneathiella sp.]|jgi:hypothetical protein|uniref:DUF1289 domain-containing protein n=1 Tax=uncultured Sneathiella sp. TaxID=879315 RepID=UPI0030DB0393|tara:strand:+ start:13904 stop:14125 length:222 start_codon:yes stop_codon:yes gene_type:complete